MSEMLPPAGACVCVRPGSEDAKLIAGYGPTGTIVGVSADHRGPPQLIIMLDGGETVTSSSPENLNVIGGTD